jgi:hypothetical protein
VRAQGQSLHAWWCVFTRGSFATWDPGPFHFTSLHITSVAYTPCGPLHQVLKASQSRSGLFASSIEATDTLRMANSNPRRRLDAMAPRRTALPAMPHVYEY